MHIFFVSSVFQRFHVDFWLLLKAKKVLPPSRFWQENCFSLKFYFLSSIWIYKLLASRITENRSHCYTLHELCGFGCSDFENIEEFERKKVLLSNLNELINAFYYTAFLSKKAYLQKDPWRTRATKVFSNYATSKNQMIIKCLWRYKWSIQKVHLCWKQIKLS